ncbi:hypothetical protein B9Z55_017924 [Caenorhabditis nigoni]|uniref:7TM GPCR serpentine receptor class x (Srx) domain-containing protein n=1 Tax=Caenorhabditis nigoni TaxID=1611254 RepID=A0A2G5TBQ9_9PELO|nr:hypothetical protein B9Z55_017924 [Caenorhabditis nigoni]
MLPTLPDYINESPIFVIAIDFHYVVVPMNVIALLMVFESFTFTWLIYKNMETMNRRSLQSENTFKLQRKFLNAIYVQVAVFLVNIIVPLVFIFISLTFNIYNQAANNICFVFFSLHGLFSTLIMLWIHKPYREVCFKMLDLKRLSQKRSTVTVGATRSNRDDSRIRSTMQASVNMR